MAQGKRGPEPSLRAQWLGRCLRELRIENQITLKDAGEYIQRDGSMLARYEKADYPIRRGDVLALMTLYGVSDERVRRGLIQLAEDIWRKGWWEPYSSDLGRMFVDHPWLESRAITIGAYAPMVVPGLLQSRGYAEALIRYADPVDEDQIQRWVDLRMQRQRVLSGPDAVRFTAVIEEWVLHRPIGGSDIASHQRQHLLGLTTNPNIEIRVMPTSRGAHAGHAGAFELFDMPSLYPEVAYVETLAGTLYVERPDVDRYCAAYDELLRTSLDSSTSVELIRLIEEQQGRDPAD